MSSYLKAAATRIWQDPDTKVEHAAACCFLWEMVTALEHENGSVVHWQNTDPKTYVSLADGGTYYVLGRFEKWAAKWDRYLVATEQRTLLFSN